jgi:kinesin family member 18/19
VYTQLVAVRVRPLSEKEKNNGAEECIECVGNNAVVIKKKAQPKAVLRSQQEQLNDYCFDQVFGPDSTQHEVYHEAAANHIPSVLHGINVTVIAYGATGAGKTHTMMGSTRSNNPTEAEDGGIIPMALQDIFSGIEAAKVSQGRDGTPGHPGSTWSVKISYCEVYNECVFDLLADRESAPSGGLRVLEDATQGVVTVQGLSEVETPHPSAVRVSKFVCFFLCVLYLCMFNHSYF